MLRDTTTPTSPSLLAVAKYGLLDLEFPSQRAWSLPRMSMRELAALDLLTSLDNPDVGIELLEQFAREIIEGRFFVKLMLDAQDDTGDVHERLLRERHEWPDDLARQALLLVISA